MQVKIPKPWLLEKKITIYLMVKLFSLKVIIMHLIHWLECLTYLDIVHVDGTWPQFKRQIITGTGVPTALHLRVNVDSTSILTLRGGGSIMIGFLQPNSSDPSKQSTSLSQWNDLGIHWPSLEEHANSWFSHVPFLGPRKL